MVKIDDTIVLSTSKEHIAMRADITTISQTIRAKLDPHLAALAQLAQSEIEAMRLADLSREEVLLRLQNSIIKNNNMILKTMDILIDLRPDLIDVMSLVSGLEAAVENYSQRITDMEQRISILEQTST